VSEMEDRESVVVREASLFWQWLCRMTIKLKRASIRAVAWVVRMMLAADSHYHEQVIERLKKFLNYMERHHAEQADEGAQVLIEPRD
jgi:hypothetical protein